ncbi:hypothetical protein [Cellulomonas sp. NPDC089187]|uniref:hypothetical protein n=1 Tax=Cellulomonas sp. NPDC089187 TaxID=3154970 RepID=UPI003435163F
MRSVGPRPWEAGQLAAGAALLDDPEPDDPEAEEVDPDAAADDPVPEPADPPLDEAPVEDELLAAGALLEVDPERESVR